MLSETTLIVGGILSAIVFISGLIAKALSIGKKLEKGEQSRIDNEALINEVTVNAENTEIEEHVDSLSGDDIDAGLRDYYRDADDV